ncbi:MAG: hypothetical protein FJX68_06480 [Alphaproteobacteria bacterium]|nr:hypothetical protein [Alphaproteobacteria bacterium]
MQVTEASAVRRPIRILLLVAVCLLPAACGNRPLVRDVYLGAPALGGAAVPRDDFGNPVLEALPRRLGWW